MPVIHHLNCATMRPPMSGWVTGGRGHLVAHCLLVELSTGLVLVDSGLGNAEVQRPSMLGWPYRALAGPALDPREPAVVQLASLGYDPRDVRDVVLTHLDVDHAGGLPDFPWARVHVHAAEHQEAMSPTTRLGRQRYHANQWAHAPTWRTYSDAGDSWHGFDAVRPLDGLGDALALIPLAGHSRGHSGVAVQGDDGWLLHAGDAYFHKAQLEASPACPAPLAAFQRAIAFNDRARLRNLQALAELAQSAAAEVTVFCAHDVEEHAACVARSPHSGVHEAPRWWPRAEA